MYEIIIGRSEDDRKKFGIKGTILLGKHYVQMGQQISLSSSIYLDVIRSHVVLVCGKRGSGKSHSLGVIAEGIADLPDEIRSKVSVILLDTMGVYWTMKYPNTADRDRVLQWGYEPKSLDVQIYTPFQFYEDYKEKGIPTDFPFSLKPSELSAEDWCLTFEVGLTSSMGVFLEKIISELKESLQDKEEALRSYDIDDIIFAINKDPDTDATTKSALLNRFAAVKHWGIFSRQATPLTDLVHAGKITVLDLSCYATLPGGWAIKCLVVGLIAQKLFTERMIARKMEEYRSVKESLDPFSHEEKTQDFPLVWLVLDEAHEFLPNKGKTSASQPLITILREGRQPGISLILATQQPGKIHTDVLTQADTVLSHRVTAKVDTDALGTLMQSYMRDDLPSQLDKLPRQNGAALLFDDTNEKLYPIQVRPRITWHGGGSPSALPEEKKWEF